MSLRLIGFYHELPHGMEDGGSLRDAMRSAPGPHEREVLDYLRRGISIIVSPGPVWDVLDGSGPVGTAGVYTDGVWAWPGDLSHYVERYHLALADEFMEHASHNGWRVPELSEEQLRRLTLRQQ